MDVGPWEQGHNLFKHLFKEVEHLFIARANHVVHLVRSFAEELGMHVQQHCIMPRKLYLGHDNYMALSGIGDYLPDIIFGIVSAVNGAVVIHGAVHIAGRRPGETVRKAA